MNIYLLSFLIVVSGYFIGSISPSYIACKMLKGVDIRTVGDCNPGAANVRSILGKDISFIVALLDLVKGIVPVLIALNLKLPLFIVILSGIIVVLGHDFSMFLGFKGGKGTLTSLGVLLPLLPFEVILAFMVWLFIHYILKIRFIGSLVVFCLVPVLAWFISVNIIGHPLYIILFPIFILVLFLTRMPENIKNFFEKRKMI